MPYVTPRTLLEGRAAYAYVDDVSITVFTMPSWSDADVIRVMEETTRLGEFVTAQGALAQFFGETFNPRQRRLILAWLEKNGLPPSPRNALLTDSALMRGALTAYAWVTQAETQAFEPRDRSAACAFITRGLRARPAAVEAALVECLRLSGRAVLARGA